MASILGSIMSAAATTYYISPSGRDSYAGTSTSRPFQSMYAATQHLHPGDTLAIMPGTYPNFGISVSGVLGKPITFTAQTASNKPHIVGGTYPAVWVAANYVTISYLDVTSGQQSSAAGMQVYRANHVLVQHVVAHDSGGGGILASYGDYIILDSNIVYNNSRTASNQTSGISLGWGVNSDNKPWTHNTISNNICYNNINIAYSPGTNYTTDGNGIIMDTMEGASNYVGGTVIYNNIVYNNGGSGIRLYRSNNIDVTNNTSVGNLQGTTLYGLKGEISNVYGSNNVIRNNVAEATVSSAYSLVDAATSNSTYDYNLIYGGKSAQGYVAGSNLHVGTHNIVNHDPKFASGTNYQVQSGSPVLGHADGYVAPYRDIRGILRPTNHKSVDLGAYQQSP